LDISQKNFGSAYAQSPRKCSNIEILAKIEGKDAKFFSKIYEGHIRIGFRSKKIISCLCTFKLKREHQHQSAAICLENIANLDRVNITVGYNDFYLFDKWMQNEFYDTF
jgi:hypothetical protein